jgi:hypothetical protein
MTKPEYHRNRGLRADLLAVRALLSGPEKWTKVASARNSLGATVTPDDEDAVCWCLNGAIFKTARNYTLCHYEIRKYLPGSIVNWNDAKARTFEDVTRLLDKAIAGAP